MGLEINPLWFVAASLAVAMVPLLAAMLSSYIRISIVLNMFRSGLGAQGVPGTLVIMSLSCALTLFIMGPLIEESVSAGAKIKLNTKSFSIDSKSWTQLGPVLAPWRKFLSAHAGERELQMLEELRQKQVLPEASATAQPGEIAPNPQAEKQAEFSVLLPAFVLSELRQGFMMGFNLLVPFLVIDLIVANLLSGLGMMMASPAMIALPLKVLLFLLADGWMLLTRSLILSYAGA